MDTAPGLPERGYSRFAARKVMEAQKKRQPVRLPICCCTDGMSPSGNPRIKSLFERDRLLRAYACAGTALYTEIRIDGINITLGDGANRALTDTGTASYALVC